VPDVKHLIPLATGFEVDPFFAITEETEYPTFKELSRSTPDLLPAKVRFTSMLAQMHETLCKWQGLLSGFALQLLSEL
jgi:hypothetical protein